MISLNELKVEKGEPTNLPDSSQISLQEAFKIYDVLYKSAKSATEAGSSLPKDFKSGMNQTAVNNGSFDK